MTDRLSERLQAAGACKEVLIAAGIPAESLEGLRGRPCPRCGGTDRFAPLRDLPTVGALHCRGCFNSSSEVRPGDLIASLRWWLGLDFLGVVRWIEERFGEKRAGLSSGKTIPGIAAGEKSSGNPLGEKSPEDLFGKSTVDFLGEKSARPISLPRPAPGDLKRLSSMLEGSRKAFTPEEVRLAASELAVEGWSLQGLEAGLLRFGGSRWLAFPMRSAGRELLGLRIRNCSTREKKAITGSRAGLFIPLDLPELVFESRGSVIVVEGPTSSAAVLSAGLPVIGLPSALGGIDRLVELLVKLEVESVFVMSDPDQAGLASAKKITERIPASIASLAWRPPKDPRDWLQSEGARKMLRKILNAFCFQNWNQKKESSLWENAL